MYQLAFWAKTHPWKARVVLVLAHTILGVLAFTAGILLAQWGIGLQQVIFIISGLLFGTAWLAYPTAGGKRRSFGWRKSCDVILVLSSFTLWLWAGVVVPEYCQQETATDPPTSLLTAVLENDRTIPNFITNTIPLCEASMAVEFSHKHGSFFKKLKVWKALKGGVKKYVGMIREIKDGQLEEWEVLLLLLVNILLIMGLGYLTVFIACNLYCNGHVVWSIVALLGGIGSIVFLSSTMWRFFRRLAARKGQKR